MTKASRPSITEHNTETDEYIYRPMTDEEYAVYQADLEKEAIVREQESQKAANRAALLTQLGITEEQAKLLLG